VSVRLFSPGHFWLACCILKFFAMKFHFICVKKKKKFPLICFKKEEVLQLWALDCIVWVYLGYRNCRWFRQILTACTMWPSVDCNLLRLIEWYSTNFSHISENVCSPVNLTEENNSSWGRTKGCLGNLELVADWPLHDTGLHVQRKFSQIHTYRD